eukprot:m.56246 g.56246  ORF g.56246 m.56246 type:complete len:76 (+) comp16949_c0_seq1:140-367(+)
MSSVALQCLSHTTHSVVFTKIHIHFITPFFIDNDVCTRSSRSVIPTVQGNMDHGLLLAGSPRFKPWSHLHGTQRR